MASIKMEHIESSSDLSNSTEESLKSTFVSFWDPVHVVPLLTGIRLAPGTAEHYHYSTAPTSSHSQDHCASGLPLFLPSKPSSLSETKCSYCQVKFDCREDQVAHYHLDYHKSNLKRALNGKPPITEDQFLNEISDVSSISGSETDDDDDEEEEEEKILKKQCKIFFLNTDGEVISLYRSVLEGKRCEISGETEMIQRAQMVTRKSYWVIILMGGGHFAAAVFKGSNVIVHKTFHSYTVRSKQGGGQSGRDNKNATSHPKSAGASLRRYNEQSHAQHILELLEEWKDHLRMSNLVFIRIPGRSKHLVFGGKNSPLVTSDTRIRTVPFSTRRATFSEVKRVHTLLSQIENHGTEKVFKKQMKEKEFYEAQMLKEQTPKKLPKKRREGNRKFSKSEESANDTADLNMSISESEDDDELIELVTVQMTINTSGILSEYGSSVEDDRKKKKKKKKKKPENNSKIDNDLELLVYNLCKTGDLTAMQNINESLVNLKEEKPNSLENLPERTRNIINNYSNSIDLFSLKFGNQDKGLLHVASENGHQDLLWWLLLEGCDPTKMDKLKQLPYTLSSEKETRNTYRRFMAKYPDKYDYKKANIPSPLTPAEEEAQADKRRAQRKAKQEREKAKKLKNQEIKKLEEEKEKEELEKKRFLALDDREKRAIAAERRLLQLKKGGAGTGPALLRCFQCGADITGKVPFEYSNFKFCSTKCVREHRKK